MALIYGSKKLGLPGTTQGIDIANEMPWSDDIYDMAQHHVEAFYEEVVLYELSREQFKSVPCPGINRAGPMINGEYVYIYIYIYIYVYIGKLFIPPKIRLPDLISIHRSINNYHELY